MEFGIENLSGSIRLFGWPQNSRLESDLNSRRILVEQRNRFLFSEPDTSKSCENHPFKPFAQHASRRRRRKLHGTGAGAFSSRPPPSPLHL
jgi:hypothetical protein